MNCYGISESSFPLSNYLEYILLKIGEESVYSFPKTCSALSLFLRHILLMEAWFFILFVCFLIICSAFLQGHMTIKQKTMRAVLLLYSLRRGSWTQWHLRACLNICFLFCLWNSWTYLKHRNMNIYLPPNTLSYITFSVFELNTWL